MTIETFNQRRQEFGIIGAGMASTMKQDVAFGKGTFIIPKGASVHLWFSPNIVPSNIFVQYGNDVKITRTGKSHRYFKGIHKPPTIEKMEEDSSVCKTPTGHTVECDGYDEYGCPSWMLVMGLI